MYSRKSVGPRMELWVTLALIWYSAKTFHPDPPKGINYQEMRNETKILAWNSVKFKFMKKTNKSDPAKSLEYIKC